MYEEQNNNQMINQDMNNVEDNYPEKKSKLKIILVIVGGLVLLGLGIYLIFFTDIFSKKDSGNGVFDEGSGQDIIEKKTPYRSLRVNDDDLDNDGLLDVDEERLGTSNKEFDTDLDGIPDKMEVEIYKTDPTKFDTDGDGFGDGYEVINGYNPLGEGKL